MRHTRRLVATGVLFVGLAMACGPLAAQPAPVAIAPPAAPAPIDPERLALARDIIATGFPTDQREALFFGAVDTLISQMRKVTMAQIRNDAGAAAIIDRKLDTFIAEGKIVLCAHIPALMDGMAHGYARTFTRAELLDLKAFVNTPTGQRFFLRSPQIMRDPDFAAQNEAYLRDLQPQIGRMQAELAREMLEYMAAHPPKPSSPS